MDTSSAITSSGVTSSAVDNAMNAVPAEALNTVAQKGLLDHLLSSGLIVQLVLIILIVLSVVSWAIMIGKIMQLKRARKENEEFSNLFWETRDLNRIDDTSRRMADCPLVKVFVPGYRELNAVAKETVAGEKKDLSSIDAVMSRAEFEEVNKLERGVVFLATTATAAPFIGLFGTVWGIMTAFQGLAYAKSTTIQAVAPGISEALVATAVGLAAAIPASIGYNFFSAAIRNIRESMENFRGEFISMAKRLV